MGMLARVAEGIVVDYEPNLQSLVGRKRLEKLSPNSGQS